MPVEVEAGGDAPKLRRSYLMTRRPQQHSLSDWLDLHELSPALCRRLLDAASELASTPAGHDPAASGHYTLDLETAWESTADSMRLFFPGQKSIIDDTFEKTVRTLVGRRGRSRTALTINNGLNTYPTILYSFLGEPSDSLVLAHEFSHALQIRASEGRFVSPIMREVCAFVGEWARLSYAWSTDAAQHRRLSQVWYTDNQKYFGASRSRLIAALSQSDMVYSYSWNYPIARYLSICVQRQIPRDRMWALFKGHTSVAGLLRDLDLASDLA